MSREFFGFPCVYREPGGSPDLILPGHRWSIEGDCDGKMMGAKAPNRHEAPPILRRTYSQEGMSAAPQDVVAVSQVRPSALPSRTGSANAKTAPRRSLKCSGVVASRRCFRRPVCLLYTSDAA